MLVTRNMQRDRVDKGGHSNNIVSFATERAALGGWVGDGRIAAKFCKSIIALYSSSGAYQFAES